MDATDNLPSVFEALANAQVFNHGHLPLAAAYCRRLGLVEAVNETVSSKMELSPGLVVQAMVLDTLSGRTPLYRLEEFLEEQDVELLLGEDIATHSFNDTNLGRSLDAIFEAGPGKIITEIGHRAVREFGLDVSVVSYDTTSTNVWGDYRTSTGETSNPGSYITYGHSKDKRPDLKQFMTELLCVERGVPIFGQVLDGNSSDKTSNNTMLTRLSKLMAIHGLGTADFIYVADSAMVTEANLKLLADTRFVTRLPATYSVCNEAIDTVISTGDWEDVGSLAEGKGTQQRPNASYRLGETRVELHGKTYRAIVVHSDSHDKRRQKKQERSLANSTHALQEELKKISTVYSCEPDALQAVKFAESLRSKLHRVTASITPFKKRKRGRPPKNVPAPEVTNYRLQWDIVEKTQDIDKEKERAGCFVLISNTVVGGSEALSPVGLLQTYKGQFGIESCFSFIKDPLVVNDTFLKKPKRIDALGAILIIALLIWRLMERNMRASLANEGGSLPGWDNKRTLKPTAFMVATAMRNINVLRPANGCRLLLRSPTSKQLEYMKALGVTQEVFTNPSKKCDPINSQKINEKG